MYEPLKSLVRSRSQGYQNDIKMSAKQVKANKRRSLDSRSLKTITHLN